MKILVIDDHRLFFDALSTLLSQQSQQLEFSYCADAEQALNVITDGEPADLILLDLNLPGISGLSLLKQLQEQRIRTPVLVLSASQSLQDARAVISTGALGFISKASPGSELLRAIDRVGGGEFYVPPQWENIFDNNPQQPEGSGPEMGLTVRQQEVLHLLSQGFSNKQIAYSLALSENTVKVHVRDIFRTLNVRNRTACTVQAKRLGLL